MAEESWPRSTYNSGSITEAEYERLAARFSDDGLYNNPFNQAPFIPGSGLQILVQPDYYGSLRGFFWTSGPVEFPVPIDNNDLAAGPRQDRVVLRLDRSDWKVRVAVRKGTPGAGLPALVQNLWDTGVYEIPLGRVTVPVGATNLTLDDAVQEPLYVGSRIRFHTGADDPSAQPGALRYTGTGYESFDGTSWSDVLSDSGWVPYSVVGNWTVDNPNPLRVRRYGPIVHMRGVVLRAVNTLQSTDDDSPVASLPAGFRPANWHYYRTHLFPEGALVRIGTDGDVRLRTHNSDVPVGYALYLSTTFMAD